MYMWRAMIIYSGSDMILKREFQTHITCGRKQMLGKWCLRRSMNYSFTYEETWICKVIKCTTFFIWKHLNCIYSTHRMGSFYLFKHLTHCLLIFSSETNNIIFKKHFISGYRWYWFPITSFILLSLNCRVFLGNILNILRVGYYMFLNSEFCFS